MHQSYNSCNKLRFLYVGSDDNCSIRYYVLYVMLNVPVRFSNSGTNQWLRVRSAWVTF